LGSVYWYVLGEKYTVPETIALTTINFGSFRFLVLVAMTQQTGGIGPISYSG